MKYTLSYKGRTKKVNLSEQTLSTKKRRWFETVSNYRLNRTILYHLKLKGNLRYDEFNFLQGLLVYSRIRQVYVVQFEVGLLFTFYFSPLSLSHLYSLLPVLTWVLFFSRHCDKKKIFFFFFFSTILEGSIKKKRNQKKCQEVS